MYSHSQSVIGRITHGLIGLELCMNEGKSNVYIKDFLTLEENEIKSAISEDAVRSNIVAIVKIDDKEVGDILGAIKDAQRVASNIDCSKKEEIGKVISNLESKLDLFYSLPKAR